ncbi:MAG: hypothetical protein ACE5GA_08535, partial [Candidatus Zixiibacteriota bacterium]
GDEFWVMLGKRVFLLMPVLSIILGCWVSIACAVTVPFRQNRTDYMTNLLITWWDLGKSIVTFWGGVLKFMVNLFVTGFWLLKFAVLGLWSILHEIVFMPLRALRNAGHVVMTSRIPWIAVNLTIFWCLIEAFIFTYVTTPLVLDTFSNITGEQLRVDMVRIPLFIVLFFMILGSYAVLSTFVSSIKTKRISTIIGIGVIEIVVLFVEVVFLYREFVDSLVPWFAQYSENFELGVFGTLAISAFVWFGIRSLSWFLFAEHGTPTIMAVVQGRSMESTPSMGSQNKPFSSVSFEFLDKMKSEAAWFQQKGEEFLNSFMLPPMQVIAASINFCTLLLSSRHLFELPFSSMGSITNSGSLLKGAASRSTRRSQASQAASAQKPAAAQRGVTRETVYPTPQAPSLSPGPVGAPSGSPAERPGAKQGEYRDA